MQRVSRAEQAHQAQEGAASAVADLSLSALPQPPPLAPPSLPHGELAASFFFTKYSYSESPHYTNYREWLAESYQNDGPTAGLRAAIEAVCLAGLSNLSPANSLASASRERYGKAVRAVQTALEDFVQVVSDETLMTVFLLGLFEVIAESAGSSQFLSSLTPGPGCQL